MIKLKSLILFFAIVQMGCQDKQTPNKNLIKTKTSVSKKKVPHPIIDKKPLITQATVIDFLTQYGKVHKENKVLIETRFGSFTIQLFNDTPLHRANFIFLINQGYFNTTCFHRVVEDFIIQAGQSDKNTTRLLRQKIGNYKIPPEFRAHKHHKGAVSSARRWNQNPKKMSDAYEFFIVHKNKGLYHLNQEHTVFGEVTEGLNVIDKIAKVAIDKGEWPLENINLKVSVH